MDQTSFKTFLLKRKLYQRNKVIFAAQKQGFGKVLLYQRNLFWIKPFFKRFDVSILVFVDDFCNIEQIAQFNTSLIKFQSLFS